MDDIFVTLAGIGLFLILNITVVAFAYGKLTQKVDGVSNSVAELNNHITEVKSSLDDVKKETSATGERVSRLEGILNGRQK